MRILFVCDYNCTRSKAFEKAFKDKFPQHFTLSAGIITGNPILIHPKILTQADRIYVMTLKMAMKIGQKYGDNIRRKVRITGVGNDTFTDDKELNELIQFWMKSHEWELY